MFDKYTQMQKDRMGDILECVLRSKSLSRKKLSESLNMSSSSIVKYIKELIDIGFLRESGQESSTGGKKSALLEFNPNIGCNLVIHFQLYSLEGALINPAGDIIFRKNSSIENKSKDKLQNALLVLISDLKKEAEKLEQELFGIGIGMGDHLDMKNGISFNYHHCPDWQNVNLKEIIESQYNLPFFLINDTDAVALGELYYGKSRNYSNTLALWIGETLGMGLVLNNNIYLANHGFVGEIGHTLVESNGRLCSCGNLGCLETVSTESYIIKSCQNGAVKGVNTQLMTLGKPEDWTIEQIIYASNNGDRFCRNIFLDVSVSLANALSNTANILNPQRIILGGPVTYNNQFLLDSIKHIFSQRVLKPIDDQVEIVLSDNKNMPLLGIGSYVLGQFFHY